MKSFIVVAVLLLSASALAGLSGSSFLKKAAADQMAAVEKECQPDIKKLCSGTPPAKIMACLKSQDPKKLTLACAKHLKVPGAGK